MRILAILFICVFIAHHSNAYWQQKVDHKISVTLDDKNHILRGYQEMMYTNNSPDTLEYIFMHLYPNAYKHDHTAFAKQKVENGDTKFYYSEKYEKGFIDSLSFTANNLPLNYSKYNDNEDIVFLELVEPILPGKSITIETPFRVVIPKTFSRLGHIGQSYQITQWYPKPAVYDKDGWHMMPYLDQGEFFYEYGDYDVEMTLPSNYVVASTGDLQTESEKEFRSLRDIGKLPSGSATKEIVSKESSKTLKTIQFTQKNVHDFAWFADKQFLISTQKFQKPSGKTCTAYSFITPSNLMKYKTSAKALAETASYLSKEVGEYPYNQISIVDGPLYAGGGMEYPNIAIIGKVGGEIMVNLVIVHEAGHNWFQGILGSNEREHPWMDEGINSFYESKVVDQLRKKKIPCAPSGGNDIIYMLNGHIRQNQPIALPSIEYTDANYGGVVYAKAAKAMSYLEGFMSPEDFSKGIKEYFNSWNIKHPAPTDFREAMENNTHKNLDWFFDELIQRSEPIDLKISKLKTEGDKVTVSVKDKFGANYPVPVYAMKDSQVVMMNWARNGKTTFDKQEGIDSYVIDKNGWIPEMNKRNNRYKSSGIFKRSAPSIGIGTSIFEAGKNKAYLLPAVGFNHYDRSMLGLVFHNLTLPNKQFQFALAPLYSIRSKKLNGTGVIGYSFYPKNKLYRVTPSIRGAMFSQDSIKLNLSQPIYNRWYKINPRIRFELAKSSLRSPVERSIELNYFHIGTQDRFNFSTDTSTGITTPSVGDYEKRNIVRLNYIHKNNRTFNPFGYNFQYETTQDIAKLSAEGNIKINYFIPKKALYFRAFAGKFFYLTNETSFFDVEPYFLNTTPTAKNDYAYENTFFGRNEQMGYTSQQVMNKEGGFATRTNLLNNPLGRSDDWLVSVNVRTDIPLKYKWLPQLFFNAASFGGSSQTNPSGNTTLFEGGIQINLLSDIVRINIPLVLSKDFKNYTQSFYSKNRLVRQISFSLSTDKINFLRTQESLMKVAF